jgi:hypothetical protein
MESNNMDDYLGKFRTSLHETFAELSGSPVESQSVALGTMRLEDGRRAQVQLVVTTAEEDFIEEAG